MSVVDLLSPTDSPGAKSISDPATEEGCNHRTEQSQLAQGDIDTTALAWI